MKASDPVAWHSSIADDFDALYRSSPRFRERQAVWAEAITRFSGAGHLVLDVGCGPGAQSVLAAKLNRHVIAIDPSPEMLELCERRAMSAGVSNITFLQADLAALPGPYVAGADLILCSSVLEYLDDLDAALRTLSACLSDTGVLLLSLPNSSSLYRKLERLTFAACGRPKYYRHVRTLVTRDAAQEHLHRSGLEPLESRLYGSTHVLSPVLALLGRDERARDLILFAAERA